MPASQLELSLQMIAQLRLLDPSASAEIGTPERKIIDTVAQSLADGQVDLQGLQGALDISSKFGANLDRFLAIFGFQRQSATFATGFVTFSRPTTANQDIRIPAGTGLQAPADGVTIVQPISFATTFDVVLAANATSVIAPIQATVAGSSGNVPASTITEFVGTMVAGITAVTNATATTRGSDQETDPAFKVRFKNTIFRNLAGTQDQYLALAVATAYSTKANVIGPISRYQEYVQVPPVDDASPYDPTGQGTLIAGNGSAGQYTTALSVNPFSKYTYTTVPNFISDPSGVPVPAFYREGVDFVVNTITAAKDQGDTYRFHHVNPAIGSDPASASAANQPNVTFKNVYTGTTVNVQAVQPGEVLLFEYSYLSEASRNDVANNVTNCVDVFVDGRNPVFANTITTIPNTNWTFVQDPTNMCYFENYRRIGQPDHRPIVGNVLLPLFWQPVTSIPAEIVVNGTIYDLGTHYWPVEDVSDIGGTIRARNGLEWSTKIHGRATGDDASKDPATFTGPIILAQPAGSIVEIDSYQYDKNIADLQAALESEKQVTTDVLAHSATTRYYKLDITAVYTPGAQPLTVNTAASAAIQQMLQSAYFGQVIELARLLSIIENVQGIDDARWSSNVPGSGVPAQMFETDMYGNLRTNIVIERTQPGTASQHEVWQMYFTGTPTAGTFTIGWNGLNTASVNVATWTASAIQTAILNLLNANATVFPGSVVPPLTVVPSSTASGAPAAGTADNPLIIDWGSSGTQLPLSTTPAFTAGAYIFTTDFILGDSELPALAINALPTDSAPGLIVRQRAPNTFSRRQ